MNNDEINLRAVKGSDWEIMTLEMFVKWASSKDDAN